MCTYTFPEWQTKGASAMSVSISSRLPDHSLAQLAFDRGLHGASKSEILKYCVLVTLGMDRDKAKEVIQSRRHPSGLSGQPITSFRLEDDVYNELRMKFPGLTPSQLMRYVTAIETGYTHDQAMAIAVVRIGRPTKAAS